MRNNSEGRMDSKGGDEEEEMTGGWGMPYFSVSWSERMYVGPLPSPASPQKCMPGVGGLNHEWPTERVFPFRHVCLTLCPPLLPPPFLSFFPTPPSHRPRGRRQCKALESVAAPPRATDCPTRLAPSSRRSGTTGRSSRPSCLPAGEDGGGG